MTFYFTLVVRFLVFTYSLFWALWFPRQSNLSLKVSADFSQLLTRFINPFFFTKLRLPAEGMLVERKEIPRTDEGRGLFRITRHLISN